ncbi:hypothetical protein D3C85_1313880 [compost metagenome]
MDDFPIVATEILYFVDQNFVVEALKSAYQRWGGRHKLPREAAEFACVDLVATIHKSLFVLRVHARATFEVEAPYPLPREFEWQERFYKVAKQECVPAQNLEVVAIADLGAEAMDQFLLIRLGERDNEHTPVGR